MKNRMSFEELSAYIDGEAKDPAVVRDQLQQSETLAREHMELSKLSASMRALPVVEPRVGFARRVLAALAEAQAARRRRTARVQVGFSFGSVLALAIVGTLITTLQSAGPQLNPAIQPVASVLDEAAVYAELERQISADAASERLLLQGAFFQTPEPVMDDEHVLLLALNNRAELQSFSLAMNTSEDYEAALDQLTTSEAGALTQLLAEYARNEAPADSSHEG